MMRGRRAAPVTAVLLLLGLLTGMSTSPATATTTAPATATTTATTVAAGPECPAQYASFPRSTNPHQSISAEARPVVLVHGWSADSSVWTDGGTDSAISQLVRAFPQMIAYTFDYRDFKSTWAAAPAIASCLGSYIDAIGTTFEAAGGDGKVLAVGHSMGGMALLYAMTDRFRQLPRPGHLGGIITLDTPFLGSPFGNTLLAAWKQGRPANLPPAGSDASVCLNLHRTSNLIPRCAWSIPRELPAGVPITQVGGEITLHRKLFGFGVYDVPLGGDAIVSSTSQHGYASMFPDPPGGGHIGTGQIVRCGADYDFGLAATLNPVGGIATNATTFDFDLLSSSAIVDFMQKGPANLDAVKAVPILKAMLEGLMLGDCSHINITHNHAALATAAKALRSYDEDARQSVATRISIVTPFYSDGRARLPNDSTAGDGVDTGRCSASRVAKADNVYQCGSVAAYLPACWLDPGRSVNIYCMHAPGDASVLRFYQPLDSFSVTAPSNPAPWEIVLDDGSACRIRLGGAWSVPPTGYSYSYSCNGRYEVLLDPDDSPAIDTTRPHWTVHAQHDPTATASVLTVGVKRVTFAGAAPEVRRAATGAACPLPSELERALPSGATIGPKAPGGIQCVEDWSIAAYDYQGNTYPGIFRKVGGIWRTVTRAKLCVPPSPIPAALYSGACSVS